MISCLHFIVERIHGLHEHRGIRHWNLALTILGEVKNVFWENETRRDDFLQYISEVCMIIE